MADIKNEATKYLDDVTTTSLRAGIEHRASWFYLLLDEARKRGLEWDDFAREAIKCCGLFHGEKKIMEPCPEYQDMTKFYDAFIGSQTEKVLEVEQVEKTPDNLTLDFHYCPLITAWQKLGASTEDIEHLCDIAMDGDRGIAEKIGFDFVIDKKIAEGDDVCRIRFSKKK